MSGIKHAERLIRVLSKRQDEFLAAIDELCPEMRATDDMMKVASELFCGGRWRDIYPRLMVLRAAYLEDATRILDDIDKALPDSPAAALLRFIFVTICPEPPPLSAVASPGVN